MGKQKLNPKILSKLKKRFPKRKEGSIQARLSQLSRQHGVNLNAAAEFMARSRKFSVWGLLDEKDKAYFKDKDIQIIKVKDNSNKKNIKKIEVIVSYETDNGLLNAHIKEINKCYTATCYTASFILIRKVLENFVVEMIKHKFPSNSQQDKELYLDPTKKWRIRDFSELIKNLRSKCSSFDKTEEKLVLRILQLAEQFKDDANDKTHSLYHISNKPELDNKNPQNIFDLIKEFFEKF